MAVNNFKELEREHVERFESNTQRVSKSIKSNIRSFKFMGNILELYITTALNFLVSLTGSDSEEADDFSQNNYPNN